MKKNIFVMTLVAIMLTASAVLTRNYLNEKFSVETNEKNVLENIKREEINHVLYSEEALMNVAGEELDELINYLAHNYTESELYDGVMLEDIYYNSTEGSWIAWYIIQIGDDHFSNEYYF